jgi:hypothetical protein
MYIQSTEESMSKRVIAIVMSLSLLAMFATPALAYHSGGVAYCSGCHTMHNSVNGAPVDPNSPNGNPYLLKDGTASDVCLSCHATSHGAQWSGTPLNPPVERGAGNFVFLEATNLQDNTHGSPIPGAAGAHSIIAPSKNGVQDPRFTTAPGGTYPASAMSCTSCHNPHGNNHFRLLYGAGHVEAGNYTFTNPAPTAVGISLNGTTGESATNHTAYQGGMSAWCSNCHGAFHDGNGALLKHPSGVAMGASIAQTYNLYNGTNDQSGGNAATSYTPVIPFEDPAMTISSTAGPTATSQVSCVTCHRAHGTSESSIGRWDFNIELYSMEGVASQTYAEPNPFPVTGGAQRSMCNKCHNRDNGQ